MTRQQHCSDPVAVHARLIVLEGMPGAGKTTAAAALQRHGWQVIGEYTGADGTTVALTRHPGVEDDDAHQAIWRTCCTAAEKLPVSEARMSAMTFACWAEATGTPR